MRFRHIACAVAAAVMLTACTEQPPAAKDRHSPQQPAATEDTAVATVPASPDATRPLGVGDRIPAVRLQDIEGKAVDLAERVAEKPTLIIFYRGGWCPYCTRHLGDLGSIEAGLVELGYQVLAVSTDRPAKLAETRDKLGFQYELLSDAKMDAARAFGIAFTVDDATVTKYIGYGIDLEDASGEDHHQLPVPSVFIVGTDGVIDFAHSNPDYKLRMDPADILAAAKKATE